MEIPLSRFTGPSVAESNPILALLATSPRLLLILWLSALVGGCACQQPIQLHFYDQAQDGYASGVNPDLIRLLVDGKLLPSDAFRIAEVTDPAKKVNPGISAEEYNVIFDRGLLTGSKDGQVLVFMSDLAGNLSVFRYQPEGRCGLRQTTLPDEEAIPLWRRYVPENFSDNQGGSDAPLPSRPPTPLTTQPAMPGDGGMG